MALAASDGACITIGNFDGVHLGHQALISLARQIADNNSLAFRLITFWPHPRAVLGASHEPLTSRAEKMRLLHKLAIPAIEEIAFTPELAALSAESFVADYLMPLKMKALVIGHDFNLGRSREGNAAMLEKLGEKYGFEVTQAEPFSLDGLPVSSTRLRRCITDGDVGKAGLMLGRRYALEGRVGHGFHRGTGLGFPTANLAEPQTLMPGNGVYATFAHAAGRRFCAVTNIGMNPTFGGTTRRAETFLLDADLDLYDQPLRLEFVERLRSERKFASGEDLSAQINVDVARAREILANA